MLARAQPYPSKAEYHASLQHRSGHPSYPPQPSPQYSRPYTQQPHQGHLPRQEVPRPQPSHPHPSPAHAQQYRATSRYSPYGSPATHPRLLPAHPQIYSPAQPTATRYESAPERDVRAYTTSAPTGRYQASRGAQRDARSTSRYARALPQGYPPQQVPPPPQYQQSRPPAQAPQTFSRPAQKREVQSDSLDRVRAEQHAAILVARKVHAAKVAEERLEEETRKMRRIQLQVFVHARPTLCLWERCDAVLNSWATLEKHLWQCHLSKLPNDAPLPISSDTIPNGAHTIVKVEDKGVVCKWDKCGQTFQDGRAVYNHALIPHMGTFSARCPFNCLFEGPNFADLMAHIGRRHPTATPDDFVPGLIHHRPILPENIPSLPDPAVEKLFLLDCPTSPGPISAKTRKTVARKCFSGKHPRIERYAVRKGAVAAIAAVIENSERLNMVSIAAAKGIISPVPDLLDVGEKEEEARGQAQAEVATRLSPDSDSTRSSTASAAAESRESSVFSAFKYDVRKLSALRNEIEAMSDDEDVPRTRLRARVYESKENTPADERAK